MQKRNKRKGINLTKNWIAKFYNGNIFLFLYKKVYYIISTSKVSRHLKSIQNFEF